MEVDFFQCLQEGPPGHRLPPLPSQPLHHDMQGGIKWSAALLCEGGDEVRAQPQGLGEVIQVLRNIINQTNCLPSPFQYDKMM